MNKSKQLKEQIKRLRDEVERILKVVDVPLSAEGILSVVETENDLKWATEKDVREALKVVLRRKAIKGHVKVVTKTTTTYKFVRLVVWLRSN